MKRRDVVLLIAGAAIVVAMALIGASKSVPADDASKIHEWFKSLTQPISKASCCDMSDCKVMNPEDVVWQAGQWWYVNRDMPPPAKPMLVPVPDEKVLHDKAGQGPDGLPVLCRNGPVLYCFVPPDSSS